MGALRLEVQWKAIKSDLNTKHHNNTYPAAHVLRAAAQLLALQVGELCRQVPGGQLVFRLRLNDHLWEGTMQGALN